MLAMMFNSGCLKNNQTKRKTGLKARSSGRNPTLEGSRGMLTLISFLQLKTNLCKLGILTNQNKLLSKSKTAKYFQFEKKNTQKNHNNEFILQSLCC